MPDDFRFDVFLSHSSKDKPVVRDIAERLKKDGVKVWFDEWEIKPGDSIPAKIEEGLERSRVLVLCMSSNAFGSDWAQLESGTFRFRDPLNKERRFLPLRLDDAPIKGSLAQFLYINWIPAVREHEYAKLLESCRPPTNLLAPATESKSEQVTERVIQLDSKSAIKAYAFSTDGKRALTGTEDAKVCLWNLETKRCVRVFEGHTGSVRSLAWSHDHSFALSASEDKTLRIWEVESGRCMHVLKGHTAAVTGVTLSFDQSRALSASWDKTLRVWDLITKQCLHVLQCPSDIYGLASSENGRRAISGSHDGVVRLWDIDTGRCALTLEGHTAQVHAVAITQDGRRGLSGSVDTTVRLWDLESGRCIRVFEGHKEHVQYVRFLEGSDLAISLPFYGLPARIWDVVGGQCLRSLEGQHDETRGIMWDLNQRVAVTADSSGGFCAWDLSEFVTETRAPKVTVPALPLAPDQVQYTNAKVLLVGESGAGKTGLSKRLASNDWQPSDSTVGAWATQWKLPVSGVKGVEREIWLWDFGGQADQRLIHQLYIDETALAVLVFDGQKEDLFETLGQWDRDLTRAARKEFAKLLVAGRVDAGGLRLSRGDVEKFAAERKFRGFLETSAKRNLGCEELKQAILDAIPWDELPCRTTEVLFKRLKEEIIALKDKGRVLMRFNELRETLQLQLSGESARFTDEELRAVLTLLAGPGVLWELAFGSWVLLQPERINAYAQAVIRTLQADEHQRGCLMEERVLKGDLMYESSMERLQGDEERFVLLAMHQTLVERGLCLRQPTSKGTLLVFPSYYRKERPDIVQCPAVQVNYRFTGFLDELYATLVVRLHHSEAFQQDELWRYAADFKTNAGKQLGIKLTRSAPGVGDLEVYFDPAVSVEEKIIFSKYVHEHLLQQARDVERLRHYVCPECGTAVGNREVAMKRLNEWLKGRPPEPTGFKLRKKKEETPSIICVGCEKRVPLWDEMEQCFASPEIQQRVRDMQEEANVELDNESKERALVGEVISTVALAAQISREKNVSDHGIDMEIEFKDDAHEATHRFIFLQLKSGDSYTRKRKKDGTEVFTIKNERHARYWMASPFPVLLVIRNSEGEVRWMEIRDYLKRESNNGKKPVKQIVFEGERFDVMSVRRWRERILAGG